MKPEFEQVRQSEASRFVYHYTSLDVCLGHVLEKGELRLGPLRRTNDPREAKDPPLSVDWCHHPDSEFTGEKETGEIGEFWSELKDRTQLFCASSDDHSAFEAEAEDRAGWSRLRMWAQYGAAHAGVCLVFDRAELLASVQAEGHQVHGGHVSYGPHDESAWRSAWAVPISPSEEVACDAIVRKHVVQHYRTLFFEKDADWTAEAEWRCIVNSGIRGDIYAPIEGCLSAIVLGMSVPRTYLPAAREACAKYGAELCSVYWNEYTRSLRLFSEDNPMAEQVLSNPPLERTC